MKWRTPLSALALPSATTTTALEELHFPKLKIILLVFFIRLVRNRNLYILDKSHISFRFYFIFFYTRYQILWRRMAALPPNPRPGMSPGELIKFGVTLLSVTSFIERRRLARHSRQCPAPSPPGTSLPTAEDTVGSRIPRASYLTDT